MTKIAKKAITREREVGDTLSSVRPQRPTPSAAIAAGREGEQREQRAALPGGRGDGLGSRRELYRPRAYVDPRGDPARDRAGADRVPADLLVRAPDPGPLGPGLHLPAREPGLQQDLRRRTSHRHPDRRSSTTSAATSGRWCAASLRTLRTRAIEDADERLAWVVIVGTIPAVIVGGLGEEWIDDNLGEPWMIGVQLIVFGLLLGLADRLPAAARDVDDVNDPPGPRTSASPRRSRWLPGPRARGSRSRPAASSASTRDAAARISFLLLVPATAGAIAVQGLRGGHRRAARRGRRADDRRDRRLGDLGLPCDLRPAALRAHAQLRHLRRLPGPDRRSRSSLLIGFGLRSATF